MREFELKLAVHGSFVMPPLTDEDLGVASVEALPDLDMKTTYYDTNDLRLARFGITLRYRTGEVEGSRWTLKLPVPDEDGSVHEERHFQSSPGRVPDPARDVVTAYVRSGSLSAVASVRTRRHRWALRDHDGADLCEVVDDEVSIVEGSRIVSRFRELEIEARAFGKSGLRSVADVLMEAGAMAAEPIPKAVRALGARATAPPDVPAEQEISPDDPAVEAVRGALIRGTRRLISHDPSVRIGTDVEAIHQMRVATRRLRSDFRTFRELLDERWAEPLIDDLRWLGGSLGAVRDVDVQREHIVVVAADYRDSTEPLFQHLEHDHSRARRSLLRDLRSDRYHELLDRLVAAIEEPRITELAGKSSAEVLPPIVEKAWTKLAKAGKGLDPDDDDDRFHRVRIRAKRARYAAEAVAPALGSDGDAAMSFAKKCARVQDALGELQDAVVLTRTLTSVASRHAANGELNLALGRILEREEGRKQDARRAFRELWDALDRKKNVKWLRS
jgi:CHAD domain-containing protein